MEYLLYCSKCNNSDRNLIKTIYISTNSEKILKNGVVIKSMETSDKLDCTCLRCNYNWKTRTYDQFTKDNLDIYRDNKPNEIFS